MRSRCLFSGLSMILQFVLNSNSLCCLGVLFGAPSIRKVMNAMNAALDHNDSAFYYAFPVFIGCVRVTDSVWISTPTCHCSLTEQKSSAKIS